MTDRAPAQRRWRDHRQLYSQRVVFHQVFFTMIRTWEEQQIIPTGISSNPTSTV
jgi:hypothetical protein